MVYIYIYIFFFSLNFIFFFVRTNIPLGKVATTSEIFFFGFFSFTSAAKSSEGKMRTLVISTEKIEEKLDRFVFQIIGLLFLKY